MLLIFVNLLSYVMETSSNLDNVEFLNNVNNYLFIDKSDWEFYNHAGLSVLAFTSLLLYLLSMYLFNNYLIKSVDKFNLKNKILLKVYKYYKTTTMVENGILIVGMLVCFSGLFFVGYLLLIT